MNVNEFCSLIKSIREEKMSRKEFARRHDQWHENTLKSYEKDRLPDVDYLYLLHKETEFSFRELVEARTRVVLEGVADLEEIENAISLVQGTADYKEKQFIVIEDNAMEPHIQKGARCRIDESDKALHPGHIYCFKIEDNFTCRKVHKTLLGDLILQAENDEFIPLAFNEDYRELLNIVGRVTEASNTF